MANQTTSAPARAEAPSGINHMVFNVRDIEESHEFWTKMMGFTQTGQLDSNEGFRFYSGKVNGETNHHDLALVQVEGETEEPDRWTMRAKAVGANHIAITWPDRESWMKQIAWLQTNDVKFHLRMNHGMTHSAYVSDPNGIGIEVLYEVPDEIWKQDVNKGLNFAELLPKEGPEALEDSMEYDKFLKV